MTTATTAPCGVRYRFDIAYEGTAFHGWGTQPQFRTVQGVLEDALATLFSRLGPAPRLVVAGRTDAGVHARRQVAHCDLSEDQGRAVNVTDVASRINGIVGDRSDVIVLSTSHVSKDFDARFSALWRRYEYRLVDCHQFRDPLERHRTTWHSRVLDVDLMCQAAHALLGLHDFAAFCRARRGATTIRALQEFTWRRSSEGALVAEVKADAFCHNMVRSLVGGCVAVGEGKLSVRELVGVRDTRVRGSSFTVMPARGLTLVEVGYPEDAHLASRAKQTRGRRCSDEVDRSMVAGDL